jgi:uncharacterized Zn finger protein
MNGPQVPGAKVAPEDPGAGSALDDDHTWWGRAWLEALGQRAQLDPNRLPRGRDYARSGAVGELVVSPGEARAEVRGRKRSPYLTRVRVRPFTDDEWDRVLDVICAQLGRAAALLDGEVPPEVADDLAAAGLSLLPGSGEVGPRCSCPDEADPCKHAAAVCYLVADALDADPFIALLLRGRTRGEVLAGLRARRRGTPDTGVASQGAASGAEAGNERARHELAAGLRAPEGKASASSDRGVDARATLATPPADRPVPLPPVPPPRPGHPAALPIDPPPWRPAMREDLLGLAADAAHRAWELASGISRDAGLGLDADADLARRADRALGTPAFARLAEHSGVDVRELARRALAWRYGGSTGLDVLGMSWEPTADDSSDPAELIKAAQATLRDAAGTAVHTSGNQITAGGNQLRLGRDLLWYPFVLAEGVWEPAGPPQADPAQAAQAL